MFNVFGEVIHRAYLSQNKLISIDNSVFKLHYRLTFWILLACTALVCSRQYFGEHIRCLVDKGVPNHVVNTFCFFTATYTVLHNVSSLYAHPGVSAHVADEKIVRHAYYQWVPFVLFGQALLFYLPHLIWRNYEAGTIKTMAEGLQRLYLRAPNGRDVKIQNLSIYSPQSETKLVKDVNQRFQTISRFRINRFWAVMLVTCELLNLLNTMLQLRAMDAFLGGSFLTLGKRILYGTPGDDPFEQVFPKVTKCDFHKFGPTGGIQLHDVMCVMALNIINEKIYCLLWFWLAILVPISILALVWRLFQFFMHSRSEKFNHILLKEITGTKLNPVDVAIITRQSCFSDWLLLYYLGKNMDARFFTELLHNLAVDIEENPPPSDFEDEKKPLKSA